MEKLGSYARPSACELFASRGWVATAPTGMPIRQASSVGAWICNTSTATTSRGAKPIAFMIPISRYEETTIPVTRLATMAAVAASAKTLNATSTLVRIWLVMLKMLAISRKLVAPATLPAGKPALS